MSVVLILSRCLAYQSELECLRLYWMHTCSGLLCVCICVCFRGIKSAVYLRLYLMHQPEAHVHSAEHLHLNTYNSNYDSLALEFQYFCNDRCVSICKPRQSCDLCSESDIKHATYDPNVGCCHLLGYYRLLIDRFFSCQQLQGPRNTWPLQCPRLHDNSNK